MRQSPARLAKLILELISNLSGGGCGAAGLEGLGLPRTGLSPRIVFEGDSMFAFPLCFVQYRFGGVVGCDRFVNFWGASIR